MTLGAIITLFVSMVVLAAIPGPGIMVVISRTLSSGFRSGVLVTAGIVMGDYIFIALAVGGLTALSNTFYEAFQLVKYAGAAYLIFLGVRLLTSEKNIESKNNSKMASQSVNILAGLATTLSNPKAILFYVSFFPSFLSGPTSIYDLLVIYLVATIAIGGVMLLYAFIASAGKDITKNSALSSVLKYLSGFSLIGCGAVVATKA